MAVALVAAVVAWFALGRGRPAQAPAAPAVVTAHPALAAAPRTAPAPRAAGTSRVPDVAHDDDPAGTIRLEGQVIDDREQPVAGATVGVDANPPKLVETDASGSFVFEGLIERDYQLEARSDHGYAGPVHVRLGPMPEAVTLRLQPGGTVEVVVTDGVAPIAGADVELRAAVTWHAKTDAKGVATLEHVGAVWAPLVANATGFAPGATMLGTSGDPAAPVRVALALAHGAAVSGRVVDEAGKPVAGARVVPTRATEPFPVVDPRRDGVATKPDGSFELPILSAGTWRLTATRASYAPATSAPLVLDGTHPKLGVALVLTAGATLAGKVVDSSGAPIASATVRVVVHGNVFWRARRQALTARDGTFSIAGLPHRAIDVVAEHPSGSSQIVAVDLAAAAPPPVTLTLDVGGTIAGTVVDRSGTPVGDAQVTAEAEPTGKPGDLSTWVVRGPQATVTDQGGGFALAGLPDGSYRVYASRPGTSEDAQQLVKPVTARPGGAALRLVVAGDGKITGKVAFADGRVPATFTVRIGSTYGTPFATADGSFTLTAVAGTHSLVVDGPSFLAAKSREVAVAEGKPTEVGTIVVEPGRSVSGRVLDERGGAVAGATVAAGKLLSGGGSELYIASESIDAKDTTTDADGRYRIDGFPPGPITVVAGKDGAGRSASVAVPPGTASATLDLVLQPTTGLEGKITRSGQPLADTVVIATPIGASSNFFVVTGADGTFALDALSPASYLVYPMVGGGGGQPKDMYIVRTEVALGARAHLDIDATPGTSTIAITAKSATGVPIAMGQAFLIGAPLTVHRFSELRALDQLGIFGATPVPMHRRDVMKGVAEVEGVRAGTYTLCVGGVTGTIRPADPMALPVQCQPVKVGASGTQTVAITVPDK